MKTKNKNINNNEDYFYRSNEQFRTNFEISDDLIKTKSITKLNDETKRYQNEDHPKEIDDYTIYDYNIENNKNHEWGTKKR